MIYISYGVPKSASTFTYVVTEQVLKTAGYELATVSDAAKGRKSRLNYIDPIAWHTIENVAAEIGVQSAIIKTHGAPDKCLLEAVERRGVFASAVIRDPRDIALSLLDHARRSRELGGGDFAELETVADTFSVIDEQIVSGEISGTSILASTRDASAIRAKSNNSSFPIRRQSN